jgi:aminoglycoside phosphotransferase (APT) family kinase protein
MEAGGDLVARVDNGDGPMAGTELSLAREAEVYRALSGAAVRIPRLHAVAADGSVLLADRAAGTHEMGALDADARAAVYDDFIDALADLHLVDVRRLDLPSYRRPIDNASHATEELALWDAILLRRTTGPWPLAHFAMRVLRQCAPVHVARTVLCHGDVGPGNFMHDGTRVTALLDWEFSHIGDPMDDLAWWVFRGHDMAGDCGDLAAQLARWQARTGLPVNATSIEYYRAFVMLRWLISVASALDRGGAGMDRSVYFALVPVLSVWLPRSLATLVGFGLPEASVAAGLPPGPNNGVFAALQSDLATVIAPAAATSVRIAPRCRRPRRPRVVAGTVRRGRGAGRFAAGRPARRRTDGCEPRRRRCTDRGSPCLLLA